MKYLFKFCFLILCCTICSSCQHGAIKSYCRQLSMFTVCTDTTRLDLKGQIGAVTIYQNNYYLLLDRRINEKYKRNIFVVAPSGEVQYSIVFTENEELYQYKFHIQHDSILLQSCDDNSKAYYLDESQKKLVSTAALDTLLYQDSIYSVSSECKGEFGGLIIFKNRNTHRIYKGISTCPLVVNKIGKRYYLTSYLNHILGDSQVTVIDHPEKLDTSGLIVPLYLNASSKIKQYKDEQIHLLDTAYVTIGTTFVCYNRLIHLYTDHQNTYLGEIWKGKLFPLCNLHMKCDPILIQHFPNDRHLLIFYTDNDLVTGLMEIDHDRIKIHYLIQKKNAL